MGDSQSQQRVEAAGPSRGAVPVQRVVCLSFGAEAPVNAIAEACYRFTPQIAVRDGEAVFLEITGVRSLSSEETLFLRLHALCRRFGSMPRIGAARHAAAAFALARYGVTPEKAAADKDPIGKLPVSALADFISPFKHDADVFKKVCAMVDALKMLGVRTIGDFEKLPPRTLASRFGQEGVELGLRVRGYLLPPWPQFRIPEKIVETIDLSGSAEVSQDGERQFHQLAPCAELEPLLFVSRALIDRAMARLRGRGLRAATVEVDLKLERNWTLERDVAPSTVGDGSRSKIRAVPRRKWTFELPVPQGSAAGLLPLLRDRMDFDLQRSPLSSVATEVRFTVVETAPGHGAQTSFFSRREVEAEAWDALVGRLCQKLGENRAFVALPVDRYLPEKAWRRALEKINAPGGAARSLSRSSPPRPARVLKNPEPLSKQGDLLIHGTRRSTGAGQDGMRQLPGAGQDGMRQLPGAGQDGMRQLLCWRIREWHGPERLSGEWWQDPAFKGFHRDYYRVVAESGEQFWIFSEARTLLHHQSDDTPAGHEFYLHGYFD